MTCSMRALHRVARIALALDRMLAPAHLCLFERSSAPHDVHPQGRDHTQSFAAQRASGGSSRRQPARRCILAFSQRLGVDGEKTRTRDVRVILLDVRVNSLDYSCTRKHCLVRTGTSFLAQHAPAPNEKSLLEYCDHAPMQYNSKHYYCEDSTLHTCPA